MNYVNDITSDMVYIGGMSPQTRQAITRFSDEHGLTEWLGDREWIESHWFAWLVIMLKASEDTPDLFPKGKWATIQVMEDMVLRSAVMAIRERRLVP